MFAAQHERDLARRKYVRRSLLYRGEHKLRVAYRKLEIAGVADGDFGQLCVEIGAVLFKPDRVDAYRPRSRPRPGTE